MPHLVKVQEQYKDKGFIIIASHCQDVGKDQVLALLRQNHVNYTVVSFGRVSGDASTGIPHAFLFDETGKCVKEGHPEELVKSLDSLLDAAPHWITRGKKLESPAVSKIADALKTGKTFGWALAELAKLEKKNDPKSADDVAYLKEQVTAEADRELADAQAAEADDALRASNAYDSIKTTWKSTEYAKKADERLKELKKDKSFQKELAAGKIAADVDEQVGKFIAVNGKVDLDYPANRDPAAAIAASVKKLKAQYADTKTAKRCLESVAPYGF
jgi:hypothetical protein